jgi:PAS domain S-box-containing protein
MIDHASSFEDTPAFLHVTGEAAAFMRTLDASNSPLGSPHGWPNSLRTIVSLMLGSKFPMFVAWGPELAFIYNDAYSSILGDKHPRAMGGRFQDVWSEIWAQVGPLAHRALGGEASWLEDLPLVMKRRGFEEETYFTFSYSPARDDDGRIAGLFCACTETTEKIVTGRALLESEARLRLATEGAKIGTWDWDLRKVRGSWSKRTMEILGVEESGDITPERRNETMHPEDRTRVWQELADAMSAGDDLISEYRVIRPDGEVRWIASHGAVERDAEGVPLRAAGVVLDVTDHKTAEAVLRESGAIAERERLWSLSQDMLARADYTGKMSAVSPAWKRVLGWDEEELLSRGYASFMHGDDAAATLAAIEGMAATGQPARFENRIATKDGGWKPIEWTVAPEPDKLNFIAVGRDLSHAKARDAELREAQEALRQAQKMEAVGQLTGGIAHDFNNLLTGVIGSLDMMQRQMAKGDTSKIERYATTAMTSANRAAALTHRLLAFSRRQPLDPRPVDANRLVSGMEELLRRTIGESVSLGIVTATGLWQTLCDPHQLESAILNLSINARDAMPDGGVLTIETCNAHLDDTYVARQRDVKPGQYICICVTDTGTGMTKDTIEKAFEPFFTTKPIGQGTGLGLSMIYGFARQSEGYARIYSEVGQGTTMKLYLPRYYGEAERAEEEHGELTDAHRAEAGQVVLVIEDETAVRDLVVDVLEELGYRAIEAADGPAGLAILQSKVRLDLLITDIGLPGLNGRQVVDAARQHRPDLRVLFMTGYAENAAIANGFLEPGMEMITKPFAVEALATRIRYMIEGS